MHNARYIVQNRLKFLAKKQVTKYAEVQLTIWGWYTGLETSGWCAPYIAPNPLRKLYGNPVRLSVGLMPE